MCCCCPLKGLCTSCLSPCCCCCFSCCRFCCRSCCCHCCRRCHCRCCCCCCFHCCCRPAAAAATVVAAAVADATAAAAAANSLISGFKRKLLHFPMPLPIPCSCSAAALPPPLFCLLVHAAVHTSPMRLQAQRVICLSHRCVLPSATRVRPQFKSCHPVTLSCQLPDGHQASSTSTNDCLKDMARRGIRDLQVCMCC